MRSHRYPSGPPAGAHPRLRRGGFGEVAVLAKAKNSSAAIVGVIRMRCEYGKSTRGRGPAAAGRFSHGHRACRAEMEALAGLPPCGGPRSSVASRREGRENLTTLAHFSVSSAMSLPNSAGEPVNAAVPVSAIRDLRLSLGNVATRPAGASGNLPASWLTFAVDCTRFGEQPITWSCQARRYCGGAGRPPTPLQ